MRLHIDDLSRHVGKSLGTSDWTDVTQERINTFADATDDHQWIHTDPDRAKDGPFGTPIAHGFLTLSLFIPLFSDLLDVDGATTKINYGLNKVRFPTPVPAGSRIRLTATLNAVEPVPRDGVQVVTDGTVEVEGHGKPACVLQSVTRFYR